MTGVQPGWYPDPEFPGSSRYFDGMAWTAQRMPTAAPTGPPPPGSPKGRSGCGLVLVGSVALVVVAFIGLIILGAIVGPQEAGPPSRAERLEEVLEEQGFDRFGELGRDDIDDFGSALCSRIEQVDDPAEYRLLLQLAYAPSNTERLEVIEVDDQRDFDRLVDNTISVYCPRIASAVGVAPDPVETRD